MNCGSHPRPSIPTIASRAALATSGCTASGLATSASRAGSALAVPHDRSAAAASRRTSGDACDSALTNDGSFAAVPQFTSAAAAAACAGHEYRSASSGGRCFSPGRAFVPELWLPRP